jgi:Zn-dependent M28 family amino/carboxypeptidase
MFRMSRLFIALCLALIGCRDEAPLPPKEFDGPAALGYLRAQVEFGPRIPGSEGHRRQAEWLEQLLRERADTLIVQAWPHVTATGDTLSMRNFIARFRPDAPNRVLYLAHWDTRPISDGPNSKAPKQPVPGANDGASGTAVLLGVADALKKAPPGIGVDLLFVDGEDYGDFSKQPNDVLIGTRWYTKHQPPGAMPRFAVLYDLVGDANLQLYQEGNSLTGAPDVVEKVWTVARRLGYSNYFRPDSAGRHTLTDDHVELQRVGIRAIDVVDFDYPAWHTPEDDLSKVSAASLKTVGDVAMAVIRMEQPSDKRGS